MRESNAGYFTVESREGVWWFISPQGEHQVSLGVNHVEPMLMLGPYNRETTLKRYGADFATGDADAKARSVTFTPQGSSDSVSQQPQRWETGDDIEACVAATLDFNPAGTAAREWMRQVLTDLKSWGFNALGYHTSVPRHLFRETLPYVQPIRAARVEIYWYERQELPDVFSEGFERRVDSAVKRIALDCAADPNLLGYAFSDVPPWTGYSVFGDYPVSPWIDAIRSLPAESVGKEEWIKILKTRHPDARAAAQVHGIDATTWDELLAQTEWTNPSGETALSDAEVLLARIANRWHKVHVEAIRRYDPYHLILGDKLNGNLPIPDFLMPVLRDYVDAVNIQWYGYFEDQEPTLRKIHQATGKPILLGDSAFSCIQPNQKKAKGIHCDSLEEVGEAYADYLETAISRPYVLGWHHCGYIEGWEGLPHWLCASQCGFKDPSEHVHEETIIHVRRANAQAHAWHANAMT